MTTMLDQRSLHDEGRAGATLTPAGELGTGAPSASSATPLMRDFLAWVAGCPRSYAETMEAWPSSCPRLTIWEDALGDGLVRVQRGRGVTRAEMQVTLTPRGQAILHPD